MQTSNRLRFRVVQHDQSSAIVIKVVQTWTSTCLRVLRVRVVQYDQIGTNAIKAAQMGTSIHLRVLRVRVA